MAKAEYRLVAVPDGWAVDHDGEVSQPYLTKAAALDAVEHAIRGAVNDGHEVSLHVPAGEMGVTDQGV